LSHDPSRHFSTLLCCRPGAGGEEQREVFESALKSVDATFQNLDSSEISLTDVSHYFDSDPTKLVSGLRTDGITYLLWIIQCMVK